MSILIKLILPMPCPEKGRCSWLVKVNLAFWAGAGLAEMGLFEYATSDPFYFRLDMFPRASLLIPKLKRRTMMLHFMNK